MKTSQNSPQVEQPHGDHGCEEDAHQEGHQDEDDELRGGEGPGTDGGDGGVHRTCPVRDISSPVELCDCLVEARDLHQ